MYRSGVAGLRQSVGVPDGVGDARELCGARELLTALGARDPVDPRSKGFFGRRLVPSAPQREEGLGDDVRGVLGIGHPSQHIAADRCIQQGVGGREAPASRRVLDPRHPTTLVVGPHQCVPVRHRRQRFTSPSPMRATLSGLKVQRPVDGPRVIGASAQGMP